VHADVIGAGLEVAAQSRGDGRVVPRHHEVVEQPVAAAAREVVLGVPEAQEVLAVVAESAICRS
jgi:hypothetical protein